jgi:hypothetical protein
MAQCEKPYGNYRNYTSKTHNITLYPVMVYNKKGECLSIYNNEEVESQRFCKPLKILIGFDTFDLIDADTKIYTFSKTEMKHKPTGKGYEYYYGRNEYMYLCMLSADKFIFGKKNGEMSLSSLHGTQQQTLKIEDSSPVLAVLFNKKKSTLIVVGESSQIKEYKMGSNILYLLKEKTKEDTEKIQKCCNWLES